MARPGWVIRLGLIAVLQCMACATPGGAAPAAQTFKIGGVNLRYFVEGKGAPVLLIHGLHSSAQMNWMINGVFADLAKDHQVIALDLPGHGQSDKPADAKAYGRQLVVDAIALLDHLGVKRTHVVGYSLGGMVAVKLLVDYPERTLSGTLGGMGWLREGSRLQKVWEQMPAREGSRTPPEFLHAIGQLAVTAEELKHIKVPVEIIVGQRDPVERMYVTPLRPVRPDWPVVEIPAAGHINCVVKPQFRDAVTRWVREQTKK